MYTLTDFGADISDIADRLPEAIQHAKGYQTDGLRWEEMLDYAARLEFALNLIRSMPDEVKTQIDLAGQAADWMDGAQ